ADPLGGTHGADSNGRGVAAVHRLSRAPAPELILATDDAGAMAADPKGESRREAAHSNRSLRSALHGTEEPVHSVPPAPHAATGATGASGGRAHFHADGRGGHPRDEARTLAHRERAPAGDPSIERDGAARLVAGTHV